MRAHAYLTSARGELVGDRPAVVEISPLLGREVGRSDAPTVSGTTNGQGSSRKTPRMSPHHQPLPARDRVTLRDDPERTGTVSVDVEKRQSRMAASAASSCDATEVRAASPTRSMEWGMSWELFS